MTPTYSIISLRVTRFQIIAPPGSPGFKELRGTRGEVEEFVEVDVPVAVAIHHLSGVP